MRIAQRLLMCAALALCAVQAADHAHSTKHGGIVATTGSLHVEIVFDKGKGQYSLYFSTETQEDLPASSVSEVAMTLKRPSGSPEAIKLRINDTGETWTGAGQPLDPAKAVALISYKLRGKPFSVEVPLTPRRSSHAGKHKKS